MARKYSRYTSSGRRRKGRGRQMRQVTKIGLRTHHFKRVQQLADVGAGITNYTFSLSQVTNSTEFTNLFDHYRITGAKLTFLPKVTEVNAEATTREAASITALIDPDGGSYTTKSQLLETGRAKTQLLVNKPVSIFCRPRWLNEVYRSAIGTGYGMGNPKQWLDCAFADLPHYGININIDAPVTVGYPTEVYLTLYFTCKGTR